MNQTWKIAALGTAAIVVFAVMIVNASAGNVGRNLTHDEPSNALARPSAVAQVSSIHFPVGRAP